MRNPQRPVRKLGQLPEIFAVDDDGGMVYHDFLLLVIATRLGYPSTSHFTRTPPTPYRLFH
jgi:hypothetical protein